MIKNSLVLAQVSRVKPVVVLSRLEPPPPSSTSTATSTTTANPGCNSNGNHLTMSTNAVPASAAASTHSSTSTSSNSNEHAHRQKPMLASQRAQAPTGSDPAKLTYFPLGYKDAAYQWWTSVTSPIAESNVLSYIPFVRPATSIDTTTSSSGSGSGSGSGSASDSDTSSGSGSASDSDTSSRSTDPHGNRIWHSTMVPLSGKNRALNEFSVERVGEQVDDTLVMLHGYGAGLGFFYKNFEPLSRAKGWRLYALDMLGMGNSSRPPFKVSARDQQGKIREAEDWFVDSLEEWRKIRNIERFTLMGHSLGGYLAVSYALKYPGRLNKLILASPVGIPEDPYAVNADMPEPSESALADEFTRDQESIVHDTANPHKRPRPADNNNFMNAQKKQRAAAAATGDPSSAAPQRRPLSKWFTWLWDANVSPFSIVRLSGPLGPRFVSGWTSRRFNHLPSDESQALHTYAYSLFRQRGSGEYALPYILAPGAYARSPIINRIADVGRQTISPATSTPDGSVTPPERETGIPVVMMYGDHDWMDVAGGFAAAEKLKARVVKALTTAPAEEKRRENGSARVVIVQNAGHHLYIDNADEFNKVVAEEMEATRLQGLRERERRRL